MLRLLFVIIGYLCTATVITATLGLGYLLQSGKLSDEKMFRAVALLHDVDLNQLADDQAAQEAEIPPEENSLVETEKKQQVLERNHEIKVLALERGRQEFDYLLRSLEEKTDRMERQALEIQNLVNNRRELSTQQSIDNVVANLQDMPPETAKLDLLKMMDEGREEDVIVLWIELAPKTRKKILAAIEEEDELKQLHEMHRMMLAGYPHVNDLEKAEDALNDLDSALNE